MSAGGVEGNEKKKLKLMPIVVAKIQLFLFFRFLTVRYFWKDFPHWTEYRLGIAEHESVCIFRIS